MNSKKRREENRHKRHQEKQLLEQEYEKIITGEEFEDIPNWEKIVRSNMTHNCTSQFKNKE
jgi:hypothetical protein